MLLERGRILQRCLQSTASLTTKPPKGNRLSSNTLRTSTRTTGGSGSSSSSSGGGGGIQEAKENTNSSATHSTRGNYSYAGSAICRHYYGLSVDSHWPATRQTVAVAGRARPEVEKAAGARGHAAGQTEHCILSASSSSSTSTSRRLGPGAGSRTTTTTTTCSSSGSSISSTNPMAAGLPKAATPPPPSLSSTSSLRHHHRPSSPAVQKSANSSSYSRRTAQIARHLSTTSSAQDSPRPKSTMAPQYGVRKVAAPNTLEHRVYVEQDGVPVSPFHDIPLYANQEQTILNMVVEIPRWTNGKLEVSFDIF